MDELHGFTLTSYSANHYRLPPYLEGQKRPCVQKLPRRFLRSINQSDAQIGSLL